MLRDVNPVGDPRSRVSAKAESLVFSGRLRVPCYHRLNERHLVYAGNTIVNIGLHSGHEQSSLEDLIRLWKMADDGGFYWVSVWDHLIPFSTVPATGDCHEALACLAALAYETKHVRIGCLVFCIGFRHPVVLAKHLVTLDHLSQGRLEIGLGAGWNQRERSRRG